MTTKPAKLLTLCANVLTCSASLYIFVIRCLLLGPSILTQLVAFLQQCSEISLTFIQALRFEISHFLLFSRVIFGSVECCNRLYLMWYVTKRKKKSWGNLTMKSWNLMIKTIFFLNFFFFFWPSLKFIESHFYIV